MRYEEDTDHGEVTLLIDKRHHVQRLVGQHVQGALVVLVLDVLPNNVFTGILVLLQLENVPDEELLQLLVSKVDAQLLKAANSPTHSTRGKNDGGNLVNLSQQCSLTLMSWELL